MRIKNTFHRKQRKTTNEINIECFVNCKELYSFIQKFNRMFIEHLLCADTALGPQNSCEQDRKIPCLCGGYNPVGQADK